MLNSIFLLNPIFYVFVHLNKTNVTFNVNAFTVQYIKVYLRVTSRAGARDVTRMRTKHDVERRAPLPPNDVTWLRVYQSKFESNA